MSKEKNQSFLFPEFPPVSTEEWEKKIIADLKGADYGKKLIWQTREGFEVKPYYRAKDLERLKYISELEESHPGILSRGRDTWLARENIPSLPLEEANRLALEAVKSGVDSLGFNATGITTHKQMAALLHGIDLTRTQIYFYSSKSFPLTTELFIYEVTSRGIDGASVSGGLNFDPLGYALSHGEFYMNFDSNLDEAEYLVSSILKKLPGFRVMSVNSQLLQNAGSTLSQELAFSLSSGNEYLAALIARGFKIDQIAPLFKFHFACGPDYFPEIAKLRAARILWARIVEQYQPRVPASLRMYILSSTASWNQTIYDHHVNMLRSTTEGMSAALGQADVITVLPFDRPLKECSDEFAYRIARNQQLIFREESYLDKTINPASGSYYIEALTDSLCEKAWELFLKVESMGGMKAAIETGFVQDQIDKSRLMRESEFASRKSVMIGSNQFPDLNENFSGKDLNLPAEQVVNEGKFKRIRPFRVSSPLEKLRLEVDAYVREGHDRPQAFLLSFGNPTMMRARSGFAMNFLGCAGLRITGNQGNESFQDALSEAVASKAEVIVLCSSDEEYAAQAGSATAFIRNVLPGALILIAGHPGEKESDYRASGINDFIHLRSNLLESLKMICKRIGIPSV
jgi:methylmalonyl-CoA mutase